MLPKNPKYFLVPPQLVAIEKMLKGQDFRKFLKDFFNTPHLYKGIFNGCYASFGKDFIIQTAKFSAHLQKDFSTRRSHLLSPSWKICSLYMPLHKHFEQLKLYSPPHLIATGNALW